MTQTNAGGEVVALDSGGYGATTITKEITLTAARGVHAAISPSSGNAITVNAGASDQVELFHLRLRNNGGANGIVINSGNVTIDDVSISRFGSGVFALAGTGDVTVTDTRISSGINGMGIAGPSSGTQRRRVVVENSQIRNAATGIRLDDNVRAQVSGSLIARNSTDGILAVVNSSNVVKASVSVDRSRIVNNNNALETSDTIGNGSSVVQIRIGRSTIESNTCAFVGIVQSYGDNSIFDNDGCNAPFGTIGRG